MGKLFNLKEWLTVADAARHLSIVFGEDVTEADVLRLALDGRLQLAVYLARHANAKRAELTRVPIKANRMSGCCTTDDQVLCVRDDEIIELVGLLDLPMIGSERLYVEDKCRSLLNGKSFEHASGYNVLVEDDGQLYELQWMFSDHVPLKFDESDGPETRPGSTSAKSAPHLPSWQPERSRPWKKKKATRRQPKTHTAIITTTQLILNACTCWRHSRNSIH